MTDLVAIPAIQVVGRYSMSLKRWLILLELLSSSMGYTVCLLKSSRLALIAMFDCLLMEPFIQYTQRAPSTAEACLVAA